MDETMVENVETNQAADDTLQETGLVEETYDSDDQTLDSFLEEEEQKPEEKEQPKEDSQGTSEPGWIRKRVDKAVQKAVAETEARMQAMFDQQMAPIRERMIEDEARELVRQGAVKDLETAKELVRYRQGNPQQPANQQQMPARDEKGRFTQREDPAVSARIDMLAHQADVIKAKRGIDVIAEFNNNEEVKQNVVSGRMDFYDVAEQLAKQQNARKKPPAPMRSPNGASGYQSTPISSMSDEAFEKLERSLKQGARYSLK